MRQVALTLSAVLVTCGLALGQESASSDASQLASYEQLIGNWIFDGEFLDDVPGLIQKGTKMTVRVSHEWILDKRAVEANWTITADGKRLLSGKGLTTWDAAGARIAGGEVNSLGSHNLATTTYDAATKTWTIKGQGSDADGKSVTSTIVTKIVDADTYTWQMTENSGSDLKAPTAVYTYKRDKNKESTRRPQSATRGAEAPADKNDDK